jgi:hypothetical protein
MPSSTPYTRTVGCQFGCQLYPRTDLTKRTPGLRPLAEKLMDLIDAGVKDPNELRDKTLKSLSLASAVAFVPAVHHRGTVAAPWRPVKVNR